MCCVQFADAPEEKRFFLMDGLVYTLVSLYPTVLKRPKEYREVWDSALHSKPQGQDPSTIVASSRKLENGKTQAEPSAASKPVALSPLAFQCITEQLLSNYSLSRRVKTMGMVLMQLLSPYSAGETSRSSASKPPIDQLSDLAFYRSITQTLYRSGWCACACLLVHSVDSQCSSPAMYVLLGTKLLFCIFDRTDIEEDESYDEEIEFHLLIALTELFLQFFVPFAHTIQDKSGSTTASRPSVAAVFQQAVEPVKNLWPLVQAALHGLDDSISTPQRFSLLMHVIQVFEQLEASFVSDEAGTLSKLYKASLLCYSHCHPFEIDLVCTGC